MQRCELSVCCCLVHHCSIMPCTCSRSHSRSYVRPLVHVLVGFVVFCVIVSVWCLVSNYTDGCSGCSKGTFTVCMQVRHVRLGLACRKKPAQGRLHWTWPAERQSRDVTPGVVEKAGGPQHPNFVRGQRRMAQVRLAQCDQPKNPNTYKCSTHDCCLRPCSKCWSRRCRWGWLWTTLGQG